MICRKCGADNKNANSFCVECGAPFMHENEKLEGYEWKEDESKKYKPTGIFEYIGYDILFMRPEINPFRPVADSDFWHCNRYYYNWRGGMQKR